MKRLWLLPILLFVLGALACKDESSGTGILNGYVRFQTSDGTTLAASSVRVTLNGVTVPKTYVEYSDGPGIYNAIHVDPGEYNVVADFTTADNIPAGFEPAGAEVNGVWQDTWGGFAPMAHATVQVQETTEVSFVLIDLP